MSYQRGFVLGVCLSIGVVTGSTAASESGPAVDRGHNSDEIPPALEQLGDPYRPPNAESGSSKGEGPSVIEFQGFIAIQVNVDADGRNIPGDAANEPSIAVDPLDPNRMAIGWRQFDTVESNFRQAGWGWSEDRGRTWVFPGTLTPGVFRSDPVLDTDADGRFYYYSLTDPFLCDFFFSNNRGRTWSGPRAAFGGDKQWFTIDRTNGAGRGNLYASWSLAQNPWGDRVFIRSTDGGQTFSSPIVLDPAPIWGTLTVDHEGALYLAGNASFNYNIFVVYRSLDAWDAGVEPTFDGFVFNLGGRQTIRTGPNPVGLLGQVWIAADHSDGPNRGNLYIVGSVDPPGGDPQDVHFIRSTDRGESWSLPVAINTDDRRAWQWFGTMSVAPNGRIDVVWIESVTEDESNLGQLMYAFSTDGGDSWSTAVAVSPLFDSYRGFPRQSKMGDYYDMVSDDTGADLAWAATFNDEQDVYYTRIWADCDGSGLSDSYEIWTGDVRDCNSNTAPDTCEIVESPWIDTDEDGIIDECRSAPRSGAGRVRP
jgi:hypothetical protein